MLLRRLALGWLLLGGVSFSGCGSSEPKGITPAPNNPAASAAQSSAAAVVDPAMPKYQSSADAIAGPLTSKGSDSMTNLMKLWVDKFQSLYPSVQGQVDNKGSGDAPIALMQDQATFGAMSRDWEAKEIEEFEKKFGFPPVKARSSIDMLAVYVHKDNPIANLSLQQLDAIFSSDRKGGFPREVKTWGDLGLTGEYANKPIALYGRNASSGTYKFFKEHALFNGTYKNNVSEQAGSSAVVAAVAADKFGIGYSGIGFNNSDVRTVPLAKTPDGKPFAAEPANAYSGDYPLWRYLYLSYKLKPGEKLDPLRREFMKFILSQEGQTLVLRAEYLPLPAKEVEAELKVLSLTP